jgi:Tol biopolymer transport system component
VIRRLGIVVLLLLMASFGIGVYGYLGSLKATPKVNARAVLPSHSRPKFYLQGTMFLAQGGAIFRLRSGEFTQIASGNWMQPTVTPDHTHLVAVLRSGQMSDLYLLDLDGHVVKQLTHNASRNTSFNHWSFFPRVSPDGKTVFYSYDPKDPNNLHRVDLAVYAMPLSGTQTRALRWTDPYHLSGGDVQPIPLPTGGLLYTKYNFDEQGHSYSQIWLQRGPFTISVGKALTAPADSCSQPALSPDGTRIAMICSGGQQVERLEVASFDGSSLGPATVLVDGQLAAAPAWSPDGSGLAYLAPVGPAGHFQLFYLQVLPGTTPTPATPTATATATAAASAAASPSPSPTPAPTPLQVSADLDFDTTASPAWY